MSFLVGWSALNSGNLPKEGAETYFSLTMSAPEEHPPSQETAIQPIISLRYACQLFRTTPAAGDPTSVSIKFMALPCAAETQRLHNYP